MQSTESLCLVAEDIKPLSDDGIIEVLQNQPRRMKAVLLLCFLITAAATSNLNHSWVSHLGESIIEEAA